MTKNRNLKAVIFYMDERSDNPIKRISRVSYYDIAKQAKVGESHPMPFNEALREASCRIIESNSRFEEIEIYGFDGEFIEYLHYSENI